MAEKKTTRKPVTSRKKTTKKVAKKTAKKRPSRKKIPAGQGTRKKRSDVGYKRPPAEHQFQPGQSGNPAGCPPARNNLYRHTCDFLGMTDEQIRELGKQAKLTLAQKTALKHARQLASKGLTGTTVKLTIELYNRDEGKPTEHVRMDQEEALTAEECQEIREAMKQQGGM